MSCATFLFRYDGEPLWKNEFEKVLNDTNDLLGETSSSGLFLYGEQFTVADIVWMLFLERYAAQLPCFHDGLDPRCENDLSPSLHMVRGNGGTHSGVQL